MEEFEEMPKGSMHIKGCEPETYLLKPRVFSEKDMLEFAEYIVKEIGFSFSSSIDMSDKYYNRFLLRRK